MRLFKKLYKKLESLETLNSQIHENSKYNFQCYLGNIKDYLETVKYMLKDIRKHLESLEPVRTNNVSKAKDVLIYELKCRIDKLISMNQNIKVYYIDDLKSYKKIIEMLEYLL